MNNECLASLITVSLKVTINKVKTGYRSRFIFVRYSDVSFFFRAGLWQCNPFIINIFVLRLIFRGNDLLLYFFCLFCFRTTIKRNNCYNKQKSCHFRVYLFKSTTFSESALTLIHLSLSNIFLRRQGEERVCIINFSVTTLLKLIKEFILIFQQWRGQQTSYCRNWNSGRFQPFYCLFAKWKISNHNGLFISRNSELFTWNRRRSNWSGGPLVTQRY